MRTRIAVITVGLVLAIPACSVVDDGKVEPIDPPFGLEDTLAPTSTTIAPTTTEAATTTSGVETTTTPPPVQTEDVQLYFVASGQLAPVTKALPSPVAVAQLMAALQEGEPSGDLGTGLRTALPSGPTIVVRVDTTGIALVLLTDDFLTALPPGDQRLATAQIVVTLLANVRGVGQITFNQAVTKPSGELVPAGQALTMADFEPLLDPRAVVTVPGTVGEAAPTSVEANSTSTAPGP